MNQLTIDFIPARDPNIDSRDLAKVGRQSQLILDRLKQGPASAIELNQIAFRYGARLHDLRGRGHEIETKRGADGVFIYRLVPKEET